MERSLHEHGGGIGSRRVADGNHSVDGGKSAAVASGSLPHTVAPVRSPELPTAHSVESLPRPVWTAPHLRLAD
jgi:hypothetical protein